MGWLLGTKVRMLREGRPAIWCPGCNTAHMFPTDGTYTCNGQVHNWTFNGNGDRPSFSPSMNCNPSTPEYRCHSFVTNGRIQFLDDCYHGLKGQTVDLPDWPDERFLVTEPYD